MPTRGSAEIVIVGGGVIGLSAAYFAAQEGAGVMLVEREAVGQGCSYGNAGLVVPSFSLPLARPSTLKDLPDLLLGPERMVQFRPRLEAGLVRWILRFLLACRREKMKTTADLLGRLGRESLSRFKEWADEGNPFDLREAGWLHLFDSDSGLQGGVEEAELLQSLGVKIEVLRATEVRQMERTLTDGYAGGIFYPQEAQLEPYLLCSWLAERARERGVGFLEGIEVLGLQTRSGRISGVQTKDGEIEGDRFVVAAGSWSGRIVAAQIGWLPVEPGKGYSLTFESDRPTQRPLMFGEKHIVTTPFGTRQRLTTGLDLVGFREGIDGARLEALREVGGRRLQGLDGSMAGEDWYGYRPMTPDGLPIIGPTRRFPNLHVATGHGQLGVTLAPVTGEIVAAQVLGKEPPGQAEPLSPGRFGL